MTVINPIDDNQLAWAAWFNAFANADGAAGIVSGCSISKGTGDWDIDVTSGTIVEGNTEASISSGTVTITDSSALSAGESRVTLVHADTGDALASTDGTAASDPTSPDIPAGEVLLGFVVVANGDSTAADSDIFDIPALLQNKNVLLKDGGSHELDVADLAGGNGTAGQFPESDGSAVTWETAQRPLSHTFGTFSSIIGGNNDSWTEEEEVTRLNSVNCSDYSSGVFQTVINRSNVGTAEARARDTTNNNTIGSVSTTSDSETRLSDSSLSNIPSGSATIQFQTQNTDGSSGVEITNGSLSLSV